MKVILEILGKEYSVKKLEDLILQDYHLMIDLLDMDIPEIEKIRAILKMLTDFKDFHLIRDDSLLNIDYRQIITEPKFEIDKTNLIIFNEMSFNRFIDLEITEDIPTRYALLYLSEEWEDEELIKLKEKANKIPVRLLMGSINSYLSWYKNITKQYSSLFETVQIDPEDEEEYTPPNKLDIWREIIYSLADGDILKQDEVKDRNILDIFNFLVIRKNIYEKEKNNQK